MATRYLTRGVLVLMGRKVSSVIFVLPSRPGEPAELRKSGISLLHVAARCMSSTEQVPEYAAPLCADAILSDRSNARIMRFVMPDVVLTTL